MATASALYQSSVWSCAACILETDEPDQQSALPAATQPRLNTHPVLLFLDAYRPCVEYTTGSEDCTLGQSAIGDSGGVRLARHCCFPCTPFIRSDQAPNTYQL
jgi:hypothetical protein